MIELYKYKIHCIVLITLLSVTNSYVFGQKRIDIYMNLDPEMIVNAGSDLTIDKGQQVEIGGHPTVQFGNPPYVILWSPTTSLSDPTLANPIASPEFTTTYQVTIIDNSHCIQRDEITVFVNNSTGDFADPYQNCEVYPNPVNEFISIKLRNAPGKVLIKFFNTFGVVVYQKEFYSNESPFERLDIGFLASGIYFIQIQSDQVIQKRKIIKQ